MSIFAGMLSGMGKGMVENYNDEQADRRLAEKRAYEKEKDDTAFKRRLALITTEDNMYRMRQQDDRKAKNDEWDRRHGVEQTEWNRRQKILDSKRTDDSKQVAEVFEQDGERMHRLKDGTYVKPTMEQAMELHGPTQPGEGMLVSDTETEQVGIPMGKNSSSKESLAQEKWAHQQKKDKKKDIKDEIGRLQKALELSNDEKEITTLKEKISDKEKELADFDKKKVAGGDTSTQSTANSLMKSVLYNFENGKHKGNVEAAKAFLAKKGITGSAAELYLEQLPKTESNTTELVETEQPSNSILKQVSEPVEEKQVSPKKHHTEEGNKKIQFDAVFKNPYPNKLKDNATQSEINDYITSVQNRIQILNYGLDVRMSESEKTKLKDYLRQLEVMKASAVRRRK